MLLIISTFFGLYWLIQYRSFKQTEQAFIQETPTAKIIVLQQRLSAREKTLQTPVMTSQTPTSIHLKKAK